MTTRRMVIVADDGTSWSRLFDDQISTDSAALHNTLCFIDPGDTYTIKFQNLAPKRERKDGRES